MTSRCTKLEFHDFSPALALVKEDARF